MKEINEKKLLLRSILLAVISILAVGGLLIVVYELLTGNMIIGASGHFINFSIIFILILIVEVFDRKKVKK